MGLLLPGSFDGCFLMKRMCALLASRGGVAEAWLVVGRRVLHGVPVGLPPTVLTGLDESSSLPISCGLISSDSLTETSIPLV
jgi:hypothetical protein